MRLKNLNEHYKVKSDNFSPLFNYEIKTDQGPG